MRVRGLKRCCSVAAPERCIVAPREGAWIETFRCGVNRRSFDVAPREGAWIETDTADTGQLDSESHPVRVRGLKRYIFSIVR